ncbi:MAG: hypothetical protein EA398_08015 [Deltaproteobacteria bacterium]|nr:MAG: hypothetical protein EA398_08015 [Deltaproteobacteria bacterium]
MTPQRRRNLPAVILSFVLTLILFLLVDAERRDIQTMVVPLELPALDEEQMLLSPLPEISLTLEGRRNVLRRWSLAETPSLKLPEIHEGEHDYTLRDAQIRLPAGVTLRSIVPATVRIHVETRERRMVAVRANLRGSPPEGYELGDIDVQPARVEVSGPRSSLEGLDTVFTQTISLSQQRSTVEREVDLALHRPFLSRTDDSAIRVRVDISVEETVRVLEAVPVERLGSWPSTASVEVGAVRLRVRGPRSLVERLETEEVFVSVSLDQFDSSRPGTYTVAPAVRNLPEGIEVMDLQPRDVRVRVAEHEEAPESDDETGEEGDE